jgi:hypothetical protein
VKSQSKALHPLAEHRLHPLRVVLSFKPDDEIIAVADQFRLTSQSRFHLGLKPQIQHMMQIGSKDDALPHH